MEQKADMPRGSRSTCCNIWIEQGETLNTGLQDLILAVDHKPLLGILGDKSLDCIENPQLLNFKEKMLRYNFNVVVKLACRAGSTYNKEDAKGKFNPGGQP